MEGQLEVSPVTLRFLKTSKVLIVDQNSSARVGLKKLLASMGTPVGSILEANSIAEAEEQISAHAPSLVLCDFQIGGQFGLDLIQAQRSRQPGEHASFFVLVTANTSQAAVAQAAEEDVDAFVLKPYTADGFRLSVDQAIRTRLEPSEYLSLILKGRKLLELQQWDAAAQLFLQAQTQDPKPALACSYLGLTQLYKQSFQDSEGSYSKGLSFNKIHYRCLVGLFDLLMLVKKYDAAYEVVQKLVKFFPANPKRLGAVLRLAIQTKHFDDVNAFYQGFLEIEKRDEELVRCVCAALIVCGRHFFETGDSTTGVDMVRKASVTAAGRPFLLRRAVAVLTEHGQLVEAKALLPRFSDPTDANAHFAVAALLLLEKEAKPELVVDRGYAAIKRGVVEAEVFEVTARALGRLGLSDRVAELRREQEKVTQSAEKGSGGSKAA